MSSDKQWTPESVQAELQAARAQIQNEARLAQEKCIHDAMAFFDAFSLPLAAMVDHQGDLQRIAENGPRVDRLDQILSQKSCAFVLEFLSTRNEMASRLRKMSAVGGE